MCSYDATWKIDPNDIFVTLKGSSLSSLKSVFRLILVNSRIVIFDCAKCEWSVVTVPETFSSCAATYRYASVYKYHPNISFQTAC
jgi:hypothetical protein